MQWVFMYEPIARRLIEHAVQIGEPEALIARARKACKQPGDSARHDDHMHVRVYCSSADRAYGCADIGPMELLAERQAEPSPVAALRTALTTSRVAATSGDATPVASEPAGSSAADAAPAVPALGTSLLAAPSAAGILEPQNLGRALRTPTDRLSLRSWR